MSKQATSSLAWLLPQTTHLCFVALFGFVGHVRADYDWGEAKLAGPTMGTAWHAIIEFNSYDYNPEQFQQQIEERLGEINSRMSTYEPESELSQFNASRSEDWFEVSSETARVVAKALEVAEKTDGAFDPTVGPVVNLWGFGPDGRRKEPPTNDEIAAAKAKVGYKQVKARLDPPALRKTNPDVYLDLSAIAKGYAADSVVETLKNHREGKPFVDCAMVEIGGEIRTYGKKNSNKRPWQLGVERPDERLRMITHVVEVDNGDGLATSGDYRNFFESNGQRYSHTIDPITGRPVTHGLATVTVRSPTCMEADALATALSVMGPEKGFAWAKQHDVAALMVERTESGFREQVTPAWQALEGATEDTATGSADPSGQSSVVVTYFLITALVFALAVGGMAVGVIFSNRRIKGTCGGLAGMQDNTGKTACELCTNPSPTCSGKPEEESVHS